MILPGCIKSPDTKGTWQAGPKAMANQRSDWGDQRRPAAALMPMPTSAVAPGARRSTSPPRRSPPPSSIASSRPASCPALRGIADFIGLAAGERRHRLVYVRPATWPDVGYMLASILLPAATVVLIGSLNGYAVGDYRTHVLLKIGRERRRLDGGVRLLHRGRCSS